MASSVGEIWPRSLSGDPLEGERLVRLVYVDEAGLSLTEPFVVVAAVIVDADKELHRLNYHLGYLIQKWIPAPQRPGFVFHAAQIFNGTARGSGKPFERDHPDWPMEKRGAVAKDLAQIPQKFRLKIAYGFLERAKYPEDPETTAAWATLAKKDKQIIAHGLAFMHCAMRVDRYMREEVPNEFCLMIVEDNQDSRTIIRQIQKDSQVRRYVSGYWSQFLPLRRIKEDPLFQPKRAESVLSVADFVAYICKRQLMGDKRIHPLTVELRKSLIPKYA
jgi:hypothetical protein